MAFQLNPTPSNDPAQLTTWLTKELARFEQYMTRRIPLYTEAPINPEEGQIVRADGASWNPGSGRGYYGYDNGTWTFLG